MPRRTPNKVIQQKKYEMGKRSKGWVKQFPKPTDQVTREAEENPICPELKPKEEHCNE